MQTIKMNDLLTLPSRLKAWRKKYKVTLQQVANLLKISHVAVSYWEDGANNMKYKHLIKVLELIDAPPPAPESPVSSPLAPAHSDLDPPVSPMEVVPTTKG